MALFGTVAVLTGGVAGADVVEVGTPLLQVVSRQVPVGPDGQISLRLLGETMLGGEYPRLAAERGPAYDWAFDAVAPSLADAEFVLAVAGAPFTDITVPSDTGGAGSVHTSPPPAAAALGRAGIDALSLATDQSFISGPDGLADTIGHADAAGIATIGAGSDLAQAEQPLLLRSELGTVAVVGFAENLGHRAGPDTAGPMVLSPEDIQHGADLARAAGADWVIAAPHWGDSYAPVQPRQRYWARVFADAGYDLVVGTGPHIAQPIDYIGELPVIYSLGNFVYGTTGRYASLGIPGYGLSADVVLSRDRAPRVGVRCIVTDNQQAGFQPRPCGPGEAQAFLPTLDPELDVQGDVGIVPCPCLSPRGEQ
jgi:hypothetical protein